MRTDMLDRLRADPGTRTFGELAQERQWALQEIQRLRTLVGREDTGRTHCAKASEQRNRETANPPVPPILPSQFLTIAEVAKHVGLSRASIYNMVRDGRFPKPARLGIRSLRWKFEDLVAWGNSLGG